MRRAPALIGIRGLLRLVGRTDVEVITVGPAAILHIVALRPSSDSPRALEMASAKIFPSSGRL